MNDHRPDFELFQQKKNSFFVIQLITIYGFLTFLSNTDALYSVYLFCGFAAALCLTDNTFFRNPTFTARKLKYYSFASVLLAVCIVAANYRLWYCDGIKEYLLLLFKYLMVFLGSIVIGENTLFWLDARLSGKRDEEELLSKYSLKKVSLFFFFACVGINLIVLFLADYPGNLTADSISQMEQILSGAYSNHHPYWHTMVIRCFVTLGLWIFRDINAGVACYSVFQILFMACCFTFCIITLYQMRIRWTWLTVSMAFFLFMPYHITYSVTMWKDVLFGGAVLIFSCALFRLLFRVGNRNWVNWAAFVLGGLGMCLWRSNGWIAFAATFVLFFAFFFNTHKKVSAALLLILIGTYIMIHPVLSHLGVNQPDIIESLSIPAQQIARVVAGGGELSASDRELLQKIVNIEEIPGTYVFYGSDPIKNLVRRTGDQDYLKAHSGEYLKLWVSIGIKNPREYVRSWIDQTRGYWNAGYESWIYDDSVLENDLGIMRADPVPVISNLVSFLYLVFYQCSLFDVLRSIGLCGWIITACCIVNLANRRGKCAFLAVPLLAILATLCVASPVFNEFRYAYSLFTCLPLIICTTFYEKKESV